MLVWYLDTAKKRQSTRCTIHHQQYGQKVHTCMLLFSNHIVVSRQTRMALPFALLCQTVFNKLNGEGRIMSPEVEKTHAAF